MEGLHTDKLKYLTVRQKERFKGWTFKTYSAAEITQANKARDQAIKAGAPF